MRTADQLPPPENRDRPEDPFSPEWERAFEPGWKPGPSQDKREHLAKITYVASGRSLPDTDMQALMEARPHCEPATSKQQTEHLRERLADAIENLEPRLRWIFEARFFRGMSVREVGRELSLSKSFVDRLYRQALAELGNQLTDLLGEQ